MTARLLTTSTTLTTLMTDNNVTDRVASDHERSVTGFLSEEAFGLEADASSGVVGHQAFGSGSTPREWAFVKLDLFDNTPAQELSRGQRRLKLALGILTHSTQQWLYFRSSLNGPWRNVRRGLIMDDAEDLAHYRQIELTRDQFREAGLTPRCSKFYRRGEQRRGHTARGLSCVMAEMPDPGHYLVTVIYERAVMVYELRSSGLSAAQRRAGIIATNTEISRDRPRARDLFR